MVVLQAQRLWTRFALRKCKSVGRAPHVEGRVWIHGDGEIHLGNRVRLLAASAPIELHTFRGAEIVLGDDVVIEGGTSLEAQSSIRVGARCHIHAYCKLIDNQFHPLRGDRLQRPPSEPLVLEEEVQLHSRVVLLPGAYLHRGATVLSGALVTRRFPPGSMVGGNPSKVIPP
jgi:acetyltransferase-like isoleucine patch superfamily enzyme